MNPRRVHELMRSSFPSEETEQDWINVADSNGAIQSRIARLVEENISADVLLVEVHRKLGSLLPKSEALQFVYKHILKGRIRITSRDFSGFVVIEVNGVAKGWRKPIAKSAQNTTDAAL